MAAPKGNKNALGNKGGRPAMFKDANELQQKIDDYFEIGGKKTICGLTYYLGFEDRQSLYDYQEHIRFTCIIKKARLRIEQLYEENLQGNNATGSIFALKNMGWTDKQEIKQDVNLNIQSLPSIIIQGIDT